MKRLVILAGILFVVLSIFQSCSVSEKTKLPLSGAKYKTDKNYFRARGFGKSPNLSFAKEIALMDAKENLAKKIHQKTGHGHYKSTKNSESLSSYLYGINLVDEKLFVMEDGLYQCWIVIETRKNLYQ